MSVCSTPTVEGDISVISSSSEGNTERKTRKYDPITKKEDFRLIPYFSLLEISSYMNRIVIGHAKLMGLQHDLNMSSYEYNWAISIFFLLYLICEIPSNLLMHKLGAARYLSLAMILWGSISVGMAFVTNGQQLLALRALLGVAESGYFPGIMVYISWWYCRREHTFRMAIIFASAIASCALSGILSYVFTFMNNVRGLEDWRWMLLIQSAPIILLGIITCFFLKNIPEAVHWLKPIDQQTLTRRLQEDGGLDKKTIEHPWRKTFDIFKDWKIYLYAMIIIGVLAVVKYLTTYLPLIVEAIGYRDAKVHLMTTPPYTIACICCLLVGYSASRWNDHAYHVIFCLSVALLGFILMVALIHQNQAKYAGICIASAGILSILPLLLSWLTNNIFGHRERLIAVGFVMSLGQIGGIVLPLVYDNSDPDNRRGHFICIALLAASLVITIILHLRLKSEKSKGLQEKSANIELIQY